MEKVYENALAHELRAAGLGVVQQCGVGVHYNGVVVGEYFADLLVEDVLLVERKTVKGLDDVHIMQMHELSQSQPPAALPVAEFRQAGSGNKARGQRPVSHAEASACSACIYPYLR